MHYYETRRSKLVPAFKSTLAKMGLNTHARKSTINSVTVYSYKSLQYARNKTDRRNSKIQEIPQEYQVSKDQVRVT